MSDSNAFSITINPVPTLDWVPGPGQMQTITTSNLMSGFNPIPGVPNYNVMLAYCGMSWNPWWGAAGSIVIYGGGHDDYKYNEVYRYDAATTTWERISDPVYPTYSNNGALVDSEYGEYWNDATFTTVHVGQVSADHTYAHTMCLPPDCGLPGNDPNGYFFTPGVASAVTNSGGRAWPHYMPLSNPVWQRGGAKLTSGPGYGTAFYDSTRKRVVVLSTGYRNLAFLFNCATQTAGTLAIAQPGPLSFNGVGAHDSDPAADLYMCVNVGEFVSGATVQLINPVTGAFKLATISNGSLLDGFGRGGWDWVQSWGAWIYYPGTGGKTVYKIKKPADPWNGSWVMSSETLSGADAALPIPDGKTYHFSRFRYCEAAGCFLWASTTTEKVQAFNVGAP